MNVYEHCEQSISIKPCPFCMKPMTLRKASGSIEGGHKRWFFFLYCSGCGYGPNNAYDTVYQAVKQWNGLSLADNPSAEFFAAKPASFFQPRMFH